MLAGPEAVRVRLTDEPQLIFAWGRRWPAVLAEAQFPTGCRLDLGRRRERVVGGEIRLVVSSVKPQHGQGGDHRRRPTPHQTLLTTPTRPAISIARRRNEVDALA